MTDYSELVKALRCKRDDCEGCDLAFFDKDEGWMCQYSAKDDDAAAAIEALQAEMPKQGKWLQYMPEYGDMWRCSNCHTYVRLPFRTNKMPYDFCPSCGAKMEVQV